MRLVFVGQCLVTLDTLDSPFVPICHVILNFTLYLTYLAIFSVSSVTIVFNLSESLCRISLVLLIFNRQCSLLYRCLALIRCRSFRTSLACISFQYSRYLAIFCDSSCHKSAQIIGLLASYNTNTTDLNLLSIFLFVVLYFD